MCYVSITKPNLYACVVFPMCRKGKQKLSEVQKKASVFAEIKEIRTEFKRIEGKKRENT